MRLRFQSRFFPTFATFDAAYFATFDAWSFSHIAQSLSHIACRALVPYGVSNAYVHPSAPPGTGG